MSADSPVLEIRCSRQRVSGDLEEISANTFRLTHISWTFDYTGTD